MRQFVSPFFKSPMADFGYDISDYMDVDPMFGTLEDFDELLEEAHKRNIRVVIDQVYNHTSDKHPWFIESKSSRENPKADWYIWKDPKPDGSPPNNWVHFFSGEKAESAWEWDERRKQYYLHLFAKEQPDLNWRNPEVRKAIFDSMRFWLERGVDGFRFDVASFYYKDPEFRDAIKRSQIDDSRVIYTYYWDRFCARPETILAIEDIRKLLDSYGQKVGIGEAVSDRGQNVYLEFTLEGRLHLAFNFDFMKNVTLDAQKIRDLVESTDKLFDTRAWPCYVLGNHDNYRILSRLTENMEVKEKEKFLIAKLMATLLLTLRGTPFIYYGEEIGMEDTDVPHEKIVDPLGKNLWPKVKGRDVCRTPMQWDNGRYAGFSDVEPWLPVNPNKSYMNVAREREDPNSVLNFYRSLLKMRKESLTLREGSIEFLDSPINTLVYVRVKDSNKLAVILNFSGTKVALGSYFDGSIVLGSHRKSGEKISSEITLEPFESIIIDIS